MYEIIYTSAARRLFDLQQLAKMLETARQNNQSLGVSGILLYDAGSFLQVLEGELPVVQALYDKIEKDDRHFRINVLKKGPIETRSFGNWSMGFVTLDPKLAAQFPKRHGLSSNGSLLDDASSVHAILDAFRTGRWHSYILG